MASMVKNSMFQLVLLGVVILLCSLHTSKPLETFKNPEQSVLEIEEGKWQEAHFGYILDTSDNSSSYIQGGVYFRSYCHDIKSTEGPFFRLHPETQTYCPSYILDEGRAREVKCQRIVAFIKGSRTLLNNEMISFCYLNTSNPTQPTHHIRMEQNYTIQVVDSISPSSTIETEIPTETEMPTVTTASDSISSSSTTKTKRPTETEMPTVTPTSDSTMNVSPTVGTRETVAEIRDEIKTMTEKYEITMFACQTIIQVIGFLITWICITKSCRHQHTTDDNFFLRKRKETSLSNLAAMEEAAAVEDAQMY